MMTLNKKGKNRVDAIWAKMDKNFGDDFLQSREELARETRVIPTGSCSLDDALTVGGLPKGRIVQFAGRESSGKTFMSLQAIKQWQNMAPHNWAYFIDAEFTFDEAWAVQLGVDMDRLKVVPTNDGIEIFTSICGVPDKNGGVKTPGLLHLVKEEGGSEESGLGLIVLDSVAAIQPPMEKASESGKNNMALMGRFLPPELRKITPLLAQTGVIFLAINQVRVNPGQLYGNPETTTGGSAWKHYCSVMINFGALSAPDTLLKNDAGDLMGHRIRARVDKNKVGPSKRLAEFDIEYTRGVVNQHKELADLGIKYGVVYRPNNRTYEYDGEKYVGRDNFAQTLMDKKAAAKMLAAIEAAKGRAPQKEEKENDAA